MHNAIVVFKDIPNIISEIAFHRDPTPPMGNGEGLSVTEEMVHLRRQIVKLNRRVMSIEAEQLQRQQKEKIAYAMGIAYLLFKVIAWLNRS